MRQAQNLKVVGSNPAPNELNNNIKLMFEKIEILIITFFLLLIFYLVIFLGSRKKKNNQSIEIKNYLFNVRILIIFIGIVFFILWLMF